MIQDRPKRGRPRSEGVKTAILEATLEMLVERPVREVTCDAIALRAGASKATIYKWWPNKTHLMLDALMLRVNTQAPVPDTGSACEDFVQNLRSVTAVYNSPAIGTAFRQILAEAMCNPEIQAAFRARFLDVRRQSLLVIVERAKARGDLRPEVTTDMVLDMIYGPMVMRLVTGYGATADYDAEPLVHAVFHGLAPRP